MGVLGYYNSIGARVDDNSMRTIEDNNITGAIKDDIMGGINDGVMGHIEDGEIMRAGDYRSIVALGSYSNAGTMLNDSSVEFGVCRVTIPSIPVTMSLSAADIGGILSYTKSSYAQNFRRFIFFLHSDLPYFTLSLEMPTPNF
jgi:hypothetical protein